MRFRPCIDIHNGKVKQIVGGSLSDENGASENFVSDRDASTFARMYKEDGLTGGHIILLNKAGTPEYDADILAAEGALAAYPKGLQIGGGINDTNASSFIEMGASHVIVTSFAFSDGQIRSDNIKRLAKAVGREHVVLDLSCRKRDGRYYVVTDRWQKFTDVELAKDTVDMLRQYCDELLVHAVDVEGRCSGIETEVVRILADAGDMPATYAGGVSSMEDIETIRSLGQGRVDVTVGSALDIFGGTLSYKEVVKVCR